MAAALWFERLTGEHAYGSAQRAYHGLDHLVHGLTEIRVWGANTGASEADVAILKKAFWFHDAVYGGQHQGQSNEEQSARLWEGAGLDAGEALTDTAALVRATDHARAYLPRHRLHGAMLGADLAILGQPQDVYQSYARKVRIEYSHVDEASYVAGRKTVLSHFLKLARQRTLYPDAYFSELYNEAARDNLEREIGALK